MKKNLNILSFILFAAILAGCSDNNSGKTEAKEIVVAEMKPWESIDNYQSFYLGYTQGAISDSLFAAGNEDEVLLPSEASALKISDYGKTLIITVPKGLKFADGSDLRPEDIKRSIEWGYEISPYNFDYQSIDYIGTEGDKVIINLKKYSKTIMYYLTSNWMSVLDKDIIDSMTEEELRLKARPYGLFYVDEYIPGSHAILKKNPYYKTLNENVKNKGTALIDKITVRFISDSRNVVKGIKEKTIDLAFNVSPECIDELEALNYVSISKILPPNIYFMILNKNNDFLEDENVRRAICYAIGREQISAEQNYYVKPSYSFLVPEMLDYDEAAAEYYRNNYCNDIQKAKNLLRKSGYEDNDGDGLVEKNGKILEFKLLVKKNNYHIVKFGEILCRQLGEIGIDVEVKETDEPMVRSSMIKDDYDACVQSFVWSEPSSMLPYIIDDSNNLENEAYYDLTYGASAIKDDEERSAQYTLAQKILMDEMAYIPLFQLVQINVSQNYLNGLSTENGEKYIFNDLHLSD